MLTQISSGDVRETSKDAGSIDQERDQLNRQAQGFYEAAKAKAEAGEVSEAGLLILKGLNCERRAKAKGPQVLGLIRKRD
mgnify:CR=1 FL=1